MLRELPGTLHPLAIGFLLGAHLIKPVKGLSIQLGKFGLRVESIDVRDPARHIAENHVLYFRNEMQLGGGETGVRSIRHQRRKRHEAEAI